MIRLLPMEINSADTEASALLTSVKQAIGCVPNIIATMANSPAVAKAYLAFTQALSTGALNARLREQIALVVSEQNGCDYCIAAHIQLGKASGLTDQQVNSARLGKSDSAKVDAILAFAVKVVSARGIVTDTDLAALRDAGCVDREISEIVANVALSVFTNYFNMIAGTELDFPAAPYITDA